MVNLVIVSHSHMLAEGVCEIARQMAGGAVEIAAVGGVADPAISDSANSGAPKALGTDAAAIAQAICELMTDAGVLILIDMGSACYSAEEAIQLLPPALQQRVLISNGPLVEGAIVAAVEASLGKPLLEVNAAAEEAAHMRKR